MRNAKRQSAAKDCGIDIFCANGIWRLSIAASIDPTALARLVQVLDPS